MVSDAFKCSKSIKVGAWVTCDTLCCIEVLEADDSSVKLDIDGMWFYKQDLLELAEFCTQAAELLADG
jgi:hypothetical protein